MSDNELTPEKLKEIEEKGKIEEFKFKWKLGLFDKCYINQLKLKKRKEKKELIEKDGIGMKELMDYQWGLIQRIAIFFKQFEQKIKLNLLFLQYQDHSNLTIYNCHTMGLQFFDYILDYHEQLQQLALFLRIQLLT